jgi:hypothetical protein
MAISKRRTRPRLARTQPVRSWPTLLGPQGDEPPAPPNATAGKARPRLEDAITRSVELGYRVVDDYIQQGQRAAQRLNEGKLTAEVVASEAQELSGRIARYASDFFGAWVELLELAAVGSATRQGAPVGANGAAAAAPPASPAPAARPPAGRAPAGPSMRVEVIAARPVEVAIDVRPERVSGPLRAHALRSADPRKPRLTDVSIRIDPGESVPVLRIGVPDDHPAGAYEGLVLDETTNRPVGSVRLVLAAPPPRGRRRSGKRRA